MAHRHRHGCGPRGRFEFNIPEGLFAMRGGRGWGGDWSPFHFDFGDGPPGRGRGRRGRRRMFGSGELRLVLLKLIADEPRHGYDLIRALEELTHGEYAPSPGVIYPTLTLLQDMGLIEEAKEKGPRKPFQVTDEGRKHLEENAEEVEALFERLEEEFGPRERSSGGPSIGRAVGNLMNALSHRIGRDGIDEELLHEIATILDEAAQRIERVK
ncbi:MAG TPA: PadR family transcriptional regulator [Sphingomicrobium sp.]|nr:PadR family transcriptional regulator [Sphingomicrobium sp.]